MEKTNNSYSQNIDITKTNKNNQKKILEEIKSGSKVNNLFSISGDVLDTLTYGNQAKQIELDRVKKKYQETKESKEELSNLLSEVLRGGEESESFSTTKSKELEENIKLSNLLFEVLKENEKLTKDNKELTKDNKEYKAYKKTLDLFLSSSQLDVVQKEILVDYLIANNENFIQKYHIQLNV